jgi:hypothetical protein
MYGGISNVTVTKTSDRTLVITPNRIGSRPPQHPSMDDGGHGTTRVHVRSVRPASPGDVTVGGADPVHPSSSRARGPLIGTTPRTPLRGLLAGNAQERPPQHRGLLSTEASPAQRPPQHRGLPSTEASPAQRPPQHSREAPHRLHIAYIACPMRGLPSTAERPPQHSRGG